MFSDPKRRSPALTNGHLHVAKNLGVAKKYVARPLRSREHNHYSWPCFFNFFTRWL
jgi:hypothetical protein